MPNRLELTINHKLLILSKHRIENNNFTARFCTVCRRFEIKTVGKAYSFFKNFEPNDRIVGRRASEYKKELMDYINPLNNMQ